jgi:hypothetical protein
MWLLTRDGFVSVVADKEERGNLVVRGRRREDVETVLRGCGKSGRGAVAVHYATADYEWRGWVAKTWFAEYLSKQARAIDYDNFKAEVERYDGDKERVAILHRVWSVLTGLAAPRRAAYPAGGRSILDEVEAAGDLGPKPKGRKRGSATVGRGTTGRGKTNQRPTRKRRVD